MSDISETGESAFQVKCYLCSKAWLAPLVTFLALVSFCVFWVFHGYFWFGLGIFELLIAVVLFWRRRKKKPSNLLSVRVREAVERDCKTSPKSFFESWIEQVYAPSWKSFVTVLIILAPFFTLSHLPNFQWFPWIDLKLGRLDFGDSNHYQNLIAILAGIGAIVFALIIFVAESLREDETKDRARVLLRESMLFPLTLAEIFVFLNFIWFDVNIWSIIPIFLVAGFTVMSLWRLIDILLSKVKFSRKRLRLLKDRIEQNINLAINERYGDNILLQSLGEDKTELAYYPFSLDDDDFDKYHRFSADTAGIVADIRLDKLDEFAKLVEKEANKNNRSFYKNKARPSDPAVSTDTAAVPGQSNSSQYTNVRQLLTKKYRDTVEAEDTLLLAIDKESVKDDEVLIRLRKLAKEIFVIGKEDTFSEEVNLELAGLKDQFIAAIVEKRLGKLDELIKTYISLAESFLEMLTRCGGGFNYDQARKEQGNLFGGALNIGWLEDAVNEIVEKAIESHDRKIISSVIYLPMAISIRAIKYGDQYVYQMFIRFPSRVYWLALKEPDESLREFMIDRSWRHLKEITDYYIENQLTRKIADAEKLKQHSDFSIPIFQAFLNLIKTAFDKRDFDSFEEFLTQLNSLYRHFTRDYAVSYYDEHHLQAAQNEEQRKMIEEQIALQKARQQASEEILKRKQQIFFGVAAWVFEQLRNDKENLDLKRYYDAVKNYLPSDIAELTRLFISARDFDTEHFWNWDNWELVADGEVHHIDFNSKLDRVYVVRALHLLRGITNENINTIRLPHSRDLAFLIENSSGSLANILADIETHPENWNFAIDAVEITKTDILRNLLSSAKEAQEKAEEDRVKTSELDLDKLAEFKKSLLDAFNKEAFMRPLFAKFGMFEDKVNTAKADIKAFGYNQIDEKAAFIKNWHVHYGGWGENYGQGMARSESQIIFSEILHNIAEQETITQNEIVSSIEAVLPSFKENRPIIIESLRHTFEYEAIRRSDAFINRWRQDKPKLDFDNEWWCEGYLKVGEKYVPIIRIFARDANVQNYIVVTSIKELGKFVQYSPTDAPEDAAYREGPFEMKILDLNTDDAARNKIIGQNPPWLAEHGDAEDYLRRRVLINLYEKVTIEFNETKTAFKFLVSDVPTEEGSE